MNKRYREEISQVETGGGGGPASFTWRGHRYQVTGVLGHWREDPGWWRTSDGASVRIEQADLWRVEARNGTPSQGVYELVHRGHEWKLDRVWD